MSKRSSSQSSLLSLGVKRIRCGENSSEEQPEPADHTTDDPHDDDDEGQHNPDEDALDEFTECSSDCCKADRGGPNQPKSSQILATTKRIQSHQARYVQAGWFSQHPWLSLCETRKKLFCYYCCIAERKKLMTFSNKAEDTFSKLGFCNWKKASQRFVKHEGSHAHSEAYLKVKSTVNVGSMLSEAHKKDQEMRRKMLLKQLSSLKYLLRQGLAIRGHDDKEGNLIQLLKLRAEDDSQLRTWLSDGKYLSPVIVNEQIKLMADSVLRGLLSEIRSAPWFSLIADEASDVNYKEQLCVVIRWVDEEYEIYEDPIGLVQVPKTDANTLTCALKDVLVRCILPLSQCRGQAYDDASNMSGHLRGVAARIKSKQPAALHVHCLAHCLNLCLQDAARICSHVRDALELIIELVKLIKYSPKRSSLFQSLKSQVSPDTSDLRPLCPTRWTVRTAAIGAVLSNYSTLCTVLEEVNTTGRDEYAMKAGGMLRMLEKFSTFFGLKLCFMVFSSTEQLSCTLQGKDTTIQEAKGAAMLAESHLRRQRDDDAFDKFYECVVSEAQDLTEEPVLPRRRRIPRRTVEESDCYNHETPKEYFRQRYFEVLDVISNEISRRFDQDDFSLVAEIEQIILSAGNGQEVVIPEAIRTAYKEDLNMTRLATHLSMLPDIIKSYGETTGTPIKKVTNVRTVCQALNETPGAKRLCSELHRLLTLFLTIPVTTASSERTFSAMRRLKNYLRSSMTQERLNHILLLHCHKSRTDSINVHHVMTSFISVNERREQYFGKLS